MNVINRIIYKIVKETRKWWYRSHSTLVPEGSWRDVQPVCFLGKGKVYMGENNVFGFSPSPYFFTGYCHVEARCSDAVIRIGSNNYFNNNIEISADHGEISIGSDCLVGTNVSIMNSDFHSISIANRHTGGRSKFVEIGDNVFIGSNVTILKGVHIGDNAVIAAGSVVFEDVKANTIVRGNPATFYKEIYG